MVTSARSEKHQNDDFRDLPKLISKVIRPQWSRTILRSSWAILWKMSPQIHQTPNPYFVGFPSFFIRNCFSMRDNVCSRTKALCPVFFSLFIVYVLNLFVFSFCHFLFVAFVYGRFTCMRSVLHGHFGRVSSEWAEVWMMEFMLQISKAFDFLYSIECVSLDFDF